LTVGDPVVEDVLTGSLKTGKGRVGLPAQKYPSTNISKV